MSHQSHLSHPQHRTSPPPRRLFAIGGAAMVTVTTLAGALGFGPGAAMGATPANHQRQDPAAADSVSTSSPSDPGLGGWLTVDHSPSSAANSDADRVDTDGVDTALAAGTGHGVRVVFDISDQRVWLVERGDRVSRTYLVSGSRHDILDPGTYAVYSKSPHAVSLNHRETMNYMVRFAHGDTAAIGFHDIPALDDGTLVESRSDLGTPHSAGCVRQWTTDAKALWDFTDIGTEVVVTT